MISAADTNVHVTSLGFLFNQSTIHCNIMLQFFLVLLFEISKFGEQCLKFSFHNNNLDK